MRPVSLSLSRKSLRLLLSLRRKHVVPDSLHRDPKVLNRGSAVLAHCSGTTPPHVKLMTVTAPAFLHRSTRGWQSR